MNSLLVKLIDKARSLKHQGRFREFFALVTLAKTVFLRAAIFARLPWAYAYLYWGQALHVKLHKVVESDDYERDKANSIYSKLVECLKNADNITANSMEAVVDLGQAALITGRTDEWVAMQYKIVERQEKIALAAGVDRHNLRIFDDDVIHTHIGVVFELDAWIKSGILGLRPAWRSVILADNLVRQRAVNQCLLDYWRKYFDFIEDPNELRRLRPLSNALRVRLGQFIPCGRQVIPFSNTVAAWIQTQWQSQGRKPLLELRDDHRERGWSTLERMGVPRDIWFATIHVREPGFKGKESFRDADISTYIDAMKQITDRGGWVIRMGDPSMSPLPPMPNVLDYARSAKKSDWMDVFLCAAARFMIGTSSGMISVSYIFGVPIALTNYLPTATIAFSSKDLFIPRLMRRFDDGSLIKFEELMTLPYSMGVTDGMYRNIFRVETRPNTAEEISDLVQEMMDKIDGTLEYTREDESLQQRFKAIAADREVMIGLQDFEVQCRLGRGFLRLHQHLLT